MIHKILKYNKNSKQGLTLVETLVAISVLMLSIAGPLAISAQGLVYASFAKNQISAFYLAQEAIELARNIRDENSKSGTDWLTTLDSCKTTNGKICLVDVWTIDQVVIPGTGWNVGGVAKGIKSISSCVVGPSSPCPQLVVKYFDTSLGERYYGHVFTDALNGSAIVKSSNFRRYMTITPIDNNGDITAGNPPKEVRLQAVVSWQDGAIARNVTITENLMKP